jgi:hypothetical protein
VLPSDAWWSGIAPEISMKPFALPNAILWAAAIGAAAIVGAPAPLTHVLRPSLAVVSMLVLHRGRRHGAA